MTHEAFTAMATRRLPILHMPNDSLLYLQYNKEKDSIDVGTVTNIGLSVKHSFLYDHDQSMEMNIQGVHEQLQDMKEYQQEEHIAKSAFHRQGCVNKPNSEKETFVALRQRVVGQ